MKKRKDFFLQRRTEIDQHVSATDQVELGERGILRDVLPRKNASFANPLVDPVPAVDFPEEVFQALRRDVARYVVAVRTGARLFQRRFADIRTKYLERHQGDAVIEIFQQGYGQRVDLFSGGAARRPDAHGAIHAFTRDLGEDIGLEHLKRFRITKELGDID